MAVSAAVVRDMASVLRDKPLAEVHALVVHALVVHGNAAGGGHMQAVQRPNLVVAQLQVGGQAEAVQHPKWLEAHALQLEALVRRPKCLAAIARLALASLLEVGLEVNHLASALQVVAQRMLVYGFPFHQASPLPDPCRHHHYAVCAFSFCHLHVQQQQSPLAFQLVDFRHLL